MKIFGFDVSIKRGIENPAQPITSETLATIGQLNTASGVSVTPLSSLRSSAVYACVRVIAETFASLPLDVYVRDGNGKKLATKRPEYTLLHDSPNSIMSSFVFRESMMAYGLLAGNCYAEIEWSMTGKPIGLWPIAADRVQPYVNAAGKKRYKVRTNSGDVHIDDENMLHIPSLGLDGVVGLSPIAMMRQSVGLGLAAEEFGSRLFSNGLRPSGILETPKSLSDKAKNYLKGSLQEGYTGLSNAHRFMILEEGLSYKQISISPEDAQFLETRKYQVNDIARIFRVPPHMIADLERATFSNIEQQSIDFVNNTMMSWLVRWEQELNRKLFGVGSPYFVKFDKDELLLGDMKSRYAAYAIGKQWGWLSTNDIRERENLNAVEGGDVYLQPLNMVPVGENETPEQEKKEAETETETENESTDKAES